MPILNTEANRYMHRVCTFKRMGSGWTIIRTIWCYKTSSMEGQTVAVNTFL